ncbi:40S ribosomal protein S3, putative [Leishmania tarentolae]|uniref:40S ribosomal protein S3, putative n=1 Tax=Leishmania tarentolae TaxID=5689 RepID=A0A640KS41_LEITA|nr:40S ribosomal protein S3, putative [Leishmania tarentolae]
MARPCICAGIPLRSHKCLHGTPNSDTSVDIARALLRRGDLLRLNDSDDIRKRLRRAVAASRVTGQHDLDLDANAAGAHVAVAAGGVDEGLVSRTGLDHVAVAEGHALRTLALDLSTDGDLAALGTRLHDIADDAHGGAAHLQVAQELEAEGLHLRHRGQAAHLNTLNVQLELAFLVVEALLDAGCQLADAAAVHTEHLTSLRGLNHDLRAERRDVVGDTGEAFFGQLALEKLKQFGVEHAVADDHALLGERTHFRVCVLRWGIRRRRSN